MTPTDPSPPHPDPARKAGQAMSVALKGLLDRAPGARRALPYLAALETGLAAEGTAVLDLIPLPSLQRMGVQLASLPVDLADRPLRALQVQLLAALSRHDKSADRPGKSPAFLPSAMSPDQVDVQEISETDWASASDMFNTDADQPR